MIAKSYIYGLVLVLGLMFSACGGGDSISEDDSNVTAPILKISNIVNISKKENQNYSIDLSATGASQLSYSIEGGDADSFDIDATSGLVTFRVPPDFNTQSVYSFTAVIEDALGFQTREPITVNLIDELIDTQAPVFTSPASFDFMENRNKKVQVKATDSSAVTYSILNTQTWGQYFILESNSGILLFKDEFLPDYETTHEYPLSIEAKDRFGNTAIQELVINIVNESIEHNDITYESVVSPYTGNIWLDRNLGAVRKCNGHTLDYEQCYGDYYQWGRDADGHEKADSSLHGIVAQTIHPRHENFIYATTQNQDWTSIDSLGLFRVIEWSKTDGESVCPYGYRVPTQVELEAETIASASLIDTNMKLFESFLKVPLAGAREGDAINAKGRGIRLWTSTESAFTSIALEFGSNYGGSHESNRATGNSVRCIYNTLADTTMPVFTTQATVDVYENRRDAITVVATDTSEVTYSMNNDEWGMYLSIDEHSGVMRFNEGDEPNYEIARTYYVKVTATDSSGNTNTQDITINILDEDIQHNQVEYETILSPVTGRVWLDRNLGASTMCITSNDSNCYGGYYQWGRATDGHEKVDSATTDVIATDTVPAHDKYIIFSSGDENDWTSGDIDGAIRSANWNPCPSLYRVPTKIELKSESDGMSNGEDVFSNLKLPLAGVRNLFGNFEMVGSVGYIVSSEIYSNSIPWYLYFNATTAAIGGASVSSAMQVRCIKD